MVVAPDAFVPSSASLGLPISTATLQLIAAVGFTLLVAFLCAKSLGLLSSPSSRRRKPASKKKNVGDTQNIRRSPTAAGGSASKGASARAFSGRGGGAPSSSRAIIAGKFRFITEFVPSWEEDALLLMRHGERIDHADKSWAQRVANATDPPLTNKGYGDAAEYAQMVLQKRAKRGGATHQVAAKLTCIVSSPFMRCVETAVIISQMLGAPLFIDPQLSDWHSSKLHGTRPRTDGKVVECADFAVQNHETGELENVDASSSEPQSNDSCGFVLPDQAVDRLVSFLDDKCESISASSIKCLPVWSGAPGGAAGWSVPYPETANGLDSRMKEAIASRFENVGWANLPECVKAALMTNQRKALAAGGAGMPPMRILYVTHADCVEAAAKVLCPRASLPGVSGGISVPYTSVSTLTRRRGEKGDSWKVAGYGNTSHLSAPTKVVFC